MQITNISKTLKNAKMDKKVGIKIVKLTGDDKCGMYVAEIAPGKSVRPHYHGKGVEIYQILKGQGIMKIGKVIKSFDSDSLRSEPSGSKTGQGKKVKSGDCFSIFGGEVHQLFNKAKTKLILLFICPDSHMNKDRFFIE